MLKYSMASNQIGTLSEKSLHAGLKDWFSEPGDEIEKQVGDYFVDVVKPDTLIEIQTANLGSIKNKLVKLGDEHQVILVHPIAQHKWIVRIDKKGKQVSRRKSPKTGRVEDVFRELVRASQILENPNISVWVTLVKLEEIWVDDGEGSWRRKHWSIKDKVLLAVVDTIKFEQGSDWLALLPKSLPQEFTNKDLAECLRIQNGLAQKMTYTLRKINLIDVIGKSGNANLHQISRKNK